MNRKEIQRLVGLIFGKYHEMTDDSFDPRFITQLRWRNLCSSVGITVSNLSDELEYPAHLLEEIILVADPSQSGVWFEMSHDTAIKIVYMGMP